MIRNVMKILKKFENALIDKSSKSYLQIFFFSNCQKVVPYKVSKVKKQNMYSMYVFSKIKKHVFTLKLPGYIKTLKTRKVLKIFCFFLDSVQSVWYIGWRKFLVN
jgi:hypothetical protein